MPMSVRMAKRLIEGYGWQPYQTGSGQLDLVRGVKWEISFIGHKSITCMVTNTQWDNLMAIQAAKERKGGQTR